MLPSRTVQQRCVAIEGGAARPVLNRPDGSHQRGSIAVGSSARATAVVVRRPPREGQAEGGVDAMARRKPLLTLIALLLVLALGPIGSAAVDAQTGTPAASPAASGPPVALAFFMASAANSYAQAQLEGVNEAAQA